MGACDPEKSETAEETTPTSHPPEKEQRTQLVMLQTEATKGEDPPCCHCKTCRHEAKLKTLVNIEPPTEANRMLTTFQVSYGKGHPQYRSLMAALSGVPVKDTGGWDTEPLGYRLVRPLCPLAHPGQATCSPYIPSVSPGPVYERFGPFPGDTEYQDTISNNGMLIWLSSQQIRAARPPTCVCPPDSQSGSPPICCQTESKSAVACPQ